MELKTHFSFERENSACVLSDFECGIAQIDEYIHNNLQVDLQNHACNLYVVYTADRQIAAMFALSSDSIVLDNDDRDDVSCGVWSPNFETGEQKDRFLEQTKYSAIEIYHLAVHKDFQGKHLGRFIIQEIIKQVKSKAIAGCQFITLNALFDKGYCTSNFYAKCGFLMTTRNGSIQNGTNTIRMHMPIQY